MSAARALVLGGTGQLGLACAARLLRDGWAVTLASRGRTPPTAPVPDGAATATLDRDDTEALRAAAGGVDLLVDAVCYTADQARQLVDLDDAVGQLSVVSTLSVYADDAGHGFETGGPFPAYPVPITEDQPRVPAGDTGYSDRKVAVEDTLLAGARVPVTIIRPGAITGPGSGHPREIWAYLRTRDGRSFVPLAHAGVSRFQPSAAANVAELVARAAGRPGTRVLNAVDPDCPTVAELVQAVADAVGHTWAQLLLPGPAVDGVGETPYSVAAPVVASDARARAELGYAPVVTALDAVRDTVRWLDGLLADRDWRDALPAVARMYGDRLTDYAAEDAALRTLAGG